MLIVVLPDVAPLEVEPGVLSVSSQSMVTGVEGAFAQETVVS